MRVLSKSLAVVLLLAFLAVAGAAVVRIPRSALPPLDGLPLAEARRWGYQLQHLDPATVAADIDILVTDYSRDGSASGAWSAADVAALRLRDGARPRRVLAYLSIGEAERYRYYWRRHWRLAPPAWLGKENPEWRGNFAVRYWDPGWQRILLDPEPSLLIRLAEVFVPSLAAPPYLDQILEAGFDGVYLDRVDAFEDWEGRHAGADADMRRLVALIAAYARRRRPGFLVVPQNGEALLADQAHLAVVDAVAKEDLLYGADSDGARNSDDDIRDVAALLARVRDAGKPVMVVEYVADPALQGQARAEVEAMGFLPLFAQRDLGQPPAPLPAAAAVPVPGEPVPSLTKPDQ